MDRRRLKRGFVAGSVGEQFVDRLGTRRCQRVIDEATNGIALFKLPVGVFTVTVRFIPP
jgi:hypothetical protein